MKAFLTKFWMSLTIILVGPPALLVFWLWCLYLTWTKDLSLVEYATKMNALRKAKGEESIPFLENFNETFNIVGPWLLTGLLYMITLVPMVILLVVTVGFFTPVLIWFGVATSLWAYVVVNEKSAGWTPIATSINCYIGATDILSGTGTDTRTSEM